MSNLVEHAKRELDIFWLEGSEQRDKIQNIVMKLMEVLSKDCHTVKIVRCALDFFYKLAHGRLLSPLTGEDDEWEPEFGATIPNKRDPYVVKRADNGQAYWIAEDDIVPIEFPWTPPYLKFE